MHWMDCDFLSELEEKDTFSIWTERQTLPLGKI